MPKDTGADCAAITRLIRDLCSCSENGAWSPTEESQMHSKDQFKTEIAAIRERLLSMTKKRLRNDSPKLLQMSSSKDNSVSFKITAKESDKIIRAIKPSSCGENWSLSRVWSNNLPDNFVRESYEDEVDSVLERLTSKKTRVKRLKQDSKKLKAMLSMRVRRQLKRKHPRFNERRPLVADYQRERANIPKREFIRSIVEDTFLNVGSYRSVMVDKRSDGTAVFDAKEVRNIVIKTCHDFNEDYDTLQIALRAGNFRSGRLAVEGWARGHAMPSAIGRSAPNGALALHYAAARGCIDCVRLLAGAPDTSANTAMDNDVTPVYLAAQEGHLEVLKYLVLEAGGRLDARARDGMLPIHAAAQTGCLNVVKWMIIDRGVDPNVRDGDGATPLHFAASRGHIATVRWLLRHGARLQLDRNGKSPINDAAENRHMECLNVLIEAGADCTAKPLTYKSNSAVCTCSPGGNKCASPDCVNGKRSPFYLHSPPPQDGVYVNPMQRNGAAHLEADDSSGSASSSLCSSGGSSGWYLHGGRVKPPKPLTRLFPTSKPASPGCNRGSAEGQEAPVMTVKAEIHSSSSGAASDISENGDGPRQPSLSHADHTYEDIYVRGSRNRSASRDSGSHSRPGSAAAIIVDHTLKGDISKNYEEIGRARSNGDGRRASVSSKMSGISTKSNHAQNQQLQPPSSPPAEPHSPSSGVSSASSGDEAAPPPPPPPPLPAPFREGDRANRRETDANCSPERGKPNLVNKHLVLPFIPPTFQDREPSNRLIKPSEYLRSVGREVSPKVSPEKDTPLKSESPPAPPPLPQQTEKQINQPLSAISVQELSSVRLRRTDKMPAGKTLSAPTRSMSLQCLASEPFIAQKVDLIEELKMSKDISGIKALKVERAKMENMADKEVYHEYTRHYTVESFVEQIPERDVSGNVIPAWKRQMLARRAAERAKRELEKQLASEAERRRTMAMPAWKRQLLARRESTDCRSRVNSENGVDASWRGPTRAVSIDNINFASCEMKTEPVAVNRPETGNSERSVTPEYSSHTGVNGNGNCNGHVSTNGRNQDDSEDEIRIIPWRAQLRKTNSKLNLLE